MTREDGIAFPSPDIHVLLRSTRSGLPFVQVRTQLTRGHTISDTPAEGAVLAVDQKHKRLSA